jgi:hypothetical protein
LDRDVAGALHVFFAARDALGSSPRPVRVMRRADGTADEEVLRAKSLRELLVTLRDMDIPVKRVATVVTVGPSPCCGPRRMPGMPFGRRDVGRLTGQEGG